MSARARSRSARACSSSIVDGQLRPLIALGEHAGDQFARVGGVIIQVAQQRGESLLIVGTAIEQCQVRGFFVQPTRVLFDARHAAEAREPGHFAGDGHAKRVDGLNAQAAGVFE